MGIFLGEYTKYRAGKEQQKARRAQLEIQRRRERRSQVAMVRENQILAARAQASAATGGTLDSSGFEGSQSSLTSTTASNIGFIRGADTLQQQIYDRLRGASKFQTYTSVIEAAQSAAIAAAGYKG